MSHGYTPIMPDQEPAAEEDLERIRLRIGQILGSMPSEKKMNHR